MSPFNPADRYSSRAFRDRLLVNVHDHWGVTKASHPKGTTRHYWVKQLTWALITHRQEARGHIRMAEAEEPTAEEVGLAVIDADILTNAFADKFRTDAGPCTAVRYLGLRAISRDGVLRKYGDTAGPLLWLTLPSEPAVWSPGGVTVKSLVSWHTEVTRGNAQELARYGLGTALDPLVTRMLACNLSRILQLRDVDSLAVLRVNGPFDWTVPGFIGPTGINYTNAAYWTAFRQLMHGHGIRVSQRREVLYRPNHQWGGRFAVWMSENDVQRLEAIVAGVAGAPAPLLQGLRVERAVTTHHPRYIRAALLPAANQGPTPIEGQMQGNFGVSRAEARGLVTFLRRPGGGTAAYRRLL